MFNKTKQIFIYPFFISQFFIALFFSCESPKDVSPWDSIDSNSILILESGSVSLLKDSITRSFLSKRSNLFLSSVQKLSKDDFEILYSCLIEKDSYDSILNYRSNITNQKVTSRLFNGFEIHEIKNERNEIQLGLTYLSGIFVLSRSSLLIENAIRVFQNQEVKNFKRNYEELFQFPALKSDQGNLYLNTNNRDGISILGLSTFKTIPLLNELVNLSFYDVKLSKGFLSLNGFSLGVNSSLALFQNQRPVDIKVARFIPNHSNALVHFGVSDFDAFKGNTDSLFIKRNSIGSEIAFISNQNDEKGLIALIELRPEAQLDFNFITEYSEVYSNYEIRGVDGEVLKIGFGELFPSDSFGFSTVKDNYLILASSLKEIKSIIDAIENDDTWGKTIEYQKFSEKILQESNVTLIVKKPRLLSGKESALKVYSALIDSLGLSQMNWQSVQMSALDNHFYSTINFSLGSSGIEKPHSQAPASSIINLPINLHISSLVKNHTTGLEELLIQDSDFMVYLISLRDGVLWKRQIDNSIQGSLEQLDYYKNGKLQYVFSTKDNLYIIDRLGRDVAGFPKAVSPNIQFSRLVDYDKSKNYRLLISNIENEVSLLDKEGKNISEWGPKKFEKKIARTSDHIKVGGKDFFIISFVDGHIQIFNRKGDSINSFQIRGKELFSGDYYVESGMTLKSSYLYYVSGDGVFTKQNLEGQIITSDNLLRGKNSKFMLKRVVNSDGFNIYRTDIDKLAILSKSGSIIIEKQNSGSMNLDIQTIKALNNKIIFSVFDVDQRLVQVFDESGKALIQTPIESEKLPLFGFIRSKNELGMVSFSQNSIAYSPIQ